MSRRTGQPAARTTIMQAAKSTSAGYTRFSAHAMEFPMPLSSGHYKADELRTNRWFWIFQCVAQLGDRTVITKARSIRRPNCPLSGTNKMKSSNSIEWFRSWKTHSCSAIENSHTETEVSTGSSKKMDGTWNRYNLKSTGRIYTFPQIETFEQEIVSRVIFMQDGAPPHFSCFVTDVLNEIPWCLVWKGWTNTLATSKPRSLSTWFFLVGVH